MQQTIVEKIEELTRLGKLHEAKLCLMEIKSKRIERSLRQPLAALARRLNIPSVALILLKSVVKPSERKTNDATDLEKLEYAVALSEMGATTEAHKLFQEISSNDLPQVLLYQSFTYFQNWEYKESIPLLRKYSQLGSLTDYQRAVGLANLVSAVVFEQTEDSTELAEKFVNESRKNGYSRNLAYGLQLLAQDAIEHKRFTQAEQCLIEADGMITDPQSLDRLFIRKWKAVSLLTSGNTKEGLTILREVKSTAEKLKHWETVRNCDFHESLLTENRELLLYNYFGTPYQSLKKKLVKNSSKQIFHENYVWYPSKKGNVIWNWLDEKAGIGLKSGTATYRLAKTLCSDFYRPLPVAELHAQVYPKQYYNPLTSPNRVHQLICRLKALLAKRKIPIEIKELEGTYRLLLPEGHGLTVQAQQAQSRSDALLHLAFQFITSAETFTREELAKSLKISRSSAQRLIQQAQEQGFVEKLGTTKSAYYRQKQGLKIAA